jgi:hypothetical protein
MKAKFSTMVKCFLSDFKETFVEFYGWLYRDIVG